MKKIIFLLLCFIGYSGYSQIYSFKNYTEDDGLPQSFVNELSQDNRGFIYIATANGLATYGGNSFQIFNKERGLAHDFITAIFRDSKNVMWLGHQEGKVSMLHNSGLIEQVVYKEEIGSKIIQIAELSPNNYVFLKNNTGFILYNYATTAYTNIENDNFNEVLSIAVVKDELYLLKPDGIYSIKIQNLLNKKYETNSIIKLKEAVLMRLNTAKDLIVVADNQSGILTFQNNGKLNAVDTFKLKKNDGSVYKKLITDRFANIYVATTENGVYKITPETKTILNFTTKNGLTSNTIESILIDREDNLWIGTYGSGLQQLNSELYCYYDIIDNEGHNLPVNATVKLNNRIIVATKKGIGYFHDDKVDFATHPKLAKKSINCLIRYKNSLILSSSEGELFKSDTLFKTVTQIPLITRNAKISVNSLSSDEKNIYACTTSGLYVINADNFESQLLNTESGLLHNNVRFIFIDSKKHMWVCSPGTLIYYVDDLKTVRKFEDVAGLDKFNTTVVCEDGDNNIWIASIGDGVFKYNGKFFEHFTTKNGLKSNYCYEIVADFKNGIWVGHTNGISYKNKNKKNFNKIVAGSDLLQTRFIENSFFYDTESHDILFGTSNGFSRVNTNKQHFNEVEPALNILQITLNGTKLSSTRDTILSYSSYDLAIDFVGVCLTDPSNVKYKYKLEGLQDEWQPLTRETRKIQFPKLKDGEYKLLLYASNNDDLWNSNPVTFTITIKKPFWKNYWFYIILVLVLSVSVYSLIKIRTKKLLAEQKKLEEIIVQKTSEIVEEKEKIEVLFGEIKSKNKDITDSINYAKRIQEALLPLDAYIREGFDVSCFYRAKDIVSGDFYWYKKTDKYTFIAAVDCTGHGVPGAFMSFIGSTLLDEIVTANQELNPVEILHKLDAQVNKVLNQHSREGEINMDGMDLSIAKFNPATKILEFSAAVRPVLIYRDGELQKFKSPPYSIGGAFKDIQKPFVLNIWEVKPGDNLFLFSDGIVDQQGGDRGKKYSSMRLAGFLQNIAPLTTKEQDEKINEEFYGWKGEYEQVDDVLLISVKF